MMKIRILFSICFFACTVVLMAQSKVGTTAASFLQIGVGSRNIAMGEAVGSSATDIAAIYWNPSLAATLTSSQVYINHIDWFADINLEYGAVMLNLGRWGKVAASFFTTQMDQIEVTTEERPEGTGERYSVQDMVVGLTYCRSLTDRFNIGATIKLIRSAIWNMSASTAAVDLGLSYQTPLKPLGIAMSISNFGGEMQMRGTDLAVRFDPDPRVSGNNDGIIAYQATRSWDLPVTFRFGTSLSVLQNRINSLIIHTDVLYPNNNDQYLNIGAEYGFRNTYFLRAGYRQLLLQDAEGGLALGGGLKYGPLLLDYAYCDRGRLGFTQFFGMAYGF